ncbi:non-ribosomal peptide synthetase [Montanilutibacter psychrotolerans]|nr:non-ribosomal peptide synthetase [Lysobacter psychrotolerans]
MNHTSDAHGMTTVEIQAHDALATDLTEQPSLLAADERTLLLESWNQTESRYPSELCLHQLMERQAQRSPDAIALVHEDQSLSYAQLNAQANRLAHHLIELGVKPDDRVALCVERGIAMVVGLLAILKAGGAYVPFDPTYSSARLAQVLADAAPVLLLSDAAGRNALGEAALESMIVLDLLIDLPSWSGQPDCDPQVSGLASHHLAYVIYTSGSTGTPKGVMVEHRNVVHLAHTHIARFQISPQSRVVQFASLGFDASVFELVMALTSGAALYLPAPADRQTGPALMAYLTRHAITHALLPPAFLQGHTYTLTTQPVLILGGEAPSPALVRTLASQATVINAYGPTEITVCATAWTSPAAVDELDCVPIGRPIANTRIYLLDDQAQPVPLGAVGELYIGGAGVARGYLNRPDLTAERFVTDPFSPHPGARMYRTGDLARYLPDGNLVFLGRNDHQVKLRGFRIELGEIEARLAEHPAVRESVVLAREDVPGEPRLVAYIVPTDDAAARDDLAGVLRTHLGTRLPDYMLPAAFVALDALPLTPNGKLDRTALPAPDGEAFVRRAFEAPQGEIETVLAQHWQALLGIERVGRHDHFFEMGGHSLVAVRLLSRVGEAFDIALPLATLFARPTLAELATAIASRCTDARVLALPPIVPVSREDALPLSFAQQRLWFLAQLDGVSTSYNMPLVLRLHGPLDTAALRRSLDRLFARHEGLRTVFRAVDGEPQVALLAADAGLPLIEHDLRDATDVATALAQLTAKDAQTSFDLAHGPLIRARLIRLADREHVFVITQHHIVCDGWSMSLLARELSALYTAFCQHQPDPLPPLAVQYPDYAAWEQTWLVGERLQPQADFWRRTLAEAPTVLALPTDRPRPPQQSFAAAALPVQLDVALTQRLKRLSQRHGTTLFMTLMAAWATVLARLSGQDDLVIGTPSANRSRREIEPLIGFFVNALPLRIDLSGQPSVAELLTRVRDVALAAQEHQDLPFEQVVEIARPSRRLDHTPLFQVLFAWQSNEEGLFDFPGLRVEPQMPFDAIRFDLELHLHETEETVVGTLGYATALFDAATMERHRGYLIAVLDAMAAEVQPPVMQIEMLASAERTSLLESLNQTDAVYPSELCIHQLFEQQVQRCPDAIALVHEDQSLSYAQLNAQANRLAHHLIDVGVRPDDRVALCVERSFAMVIGLLAVLKAGAAYVPLDPTYPTERLAQVLGDAAPAIVLSDAVGRRALGETATARQQTLDLDAFASLSADSSATHSNPQPLGLTPEHLAYVIYTSGSTGVPKGVAMSHGPLVNLIGWQISHAGPAQRTLQFAALGFDVAFQEIFCALCAGGSLVLIDSQVRLNFAKLIQTICTQNIQRIHLPYIAAQSLAEVIDDIGDAQMDQLRRGLRDVIVAGEQLRLTPQIKRFFQKLPDCRLHNHYGPTETHVVTAFVLGDGIQDAPTHVPIGRPIANSRAYLLDGHGQPVPFGAAGELHIGGTGIARGYLNRPELTAERFLTDPFSTHPDARMYRTGDLARYLPDGNLEFLGRNDHQVKLRGFRIELGEIEAQLSDHPSVLECAVLAREHVPGEPRLVAYVVQVGGVASRDDLALVLRSHLSMRLPEYMVPAAFVMLDVLPITPNGKLDRNALPVPDGDAYVRRTYDPPQGETETILAQLWQELLGVERVGRHDHFFELGGHSLVAVRLLSRVTRTFSIELPLAALFAQPILAELATTVAAHLAHGSAAALQAISSIPRDGMLPLSFAQQRLWFLAQLDGASANYHVPLALRLRGALDASVLRRSLDRLFARHEGLRTVFVSVNGQPHVKLLPADASLPLIEHDVRGIAHASPVLARMIAEEIGTTFDLSQGPLIRASLIRLDEQEHVFLLTMHHIVSDGWSLGVLVDELSALYAAYSQERPDPLSPLAIQYPDYAAWQRQWLAGERLQVQADYWRRRLADAPTLLALPVDRPRPPQQSFDAAFLPVMLDAELVQGVKRLGQQHGTTVFMTLLAAWSVVLSRLAGQDDLVIGTPTAGRSRHEVEPLIGFFVNTLPLRIDLSDGPRVTDLLARVRQTALDAQTHQDLPFEQVVEALKLPRRLDHTPLFQVLFAWQSNDEGVLDLPGLQVEPEPYTFEWVKFDMELFFSEKDGTIQGGFNYATALFDATTVERHRDYLVAVLQAMVADVQQPVAQIDLLAADERTLLLESWNQTELAYPTQLCLHGLFEQQVQRCPDATALVHDDGSLTYGQLNAQANRLAHYLVELGVKPDDRIALCAERSFAMVVGLLAILKAGGAYVPFDPAYSSARLTQILTDAAPVLVLSDAAGREAMGEAALESLNVVDLLANHPAWSEHPDSDPQVLGLTSHHIAYVIYTSGSTGTPKGVMVEHRNVVHLAFAQMAQFQISPQSRVAQFASLGFDASVFEVVMALCSGASLFLPTQAERQTAPAFMAYMARHAITHTILPPAFLHGHADLPQLTTRPMVMLGGEAPSPSLVRTLSERATVINAYGPTEITVCATAWTSPRKMGERDSIPIGRPIANTRLYLLDDHGQPVPLGAVGELYIGGAGVARGYLNRPDLTAERFLADPFSPHPDARMYRSGDLARYLPDGNLVFLGRNDHQVKLRGFRIELGEIEARLAEHSAVRECVVLAREDVSGEPRLVAYVVPADEAAARDDLAGVLRTHLAPRLPDYMIPAAFVALDVLPLSTHGKLDRKALPAPDGDAFVRRAFEAPRGEIETTLARLWQALLGIERVGRNDHFFDLGGHSLIAVHLIASVRQALNVDAAVRDIFRYPVLKDMAQLLLPASASLPRVLDLNAELQLDPTINAAQPFLPQAKPKHVLLTGASGFLGVFLLSSLLKKTDAIVHCLIRCASAEKGRSRLEASLASLGLGDYDRNRVVIVPGDLSRPLLGLSPARFADMAELMDVIYHNGAWVNSLHTYETLKASNVLGTQEVLRLASSGKLKHVHYISTMSTIPPIDALQEIVSTEEELFECWQGLASGYAQSKWVAEKILRIGGSRGIPFTVYRPTHISGSTRDGASNPIDTWSLFMDACLQHGCVPDVDASLNSLPVDYMSECIVDLSLRDDVIGKSLNLMNPRTFMLKQLTDGMLSMDASMKTVSYREWLDICAESTSTKNIASIMPADLATEPGVSTTQGEVKLGNAVEQLMSEGSRCPSITDELLQKYVGWRIRNRAVPPRAASDRSPPTHREICDA